MKILVIDNAAIHQKSDRFCCNMLTGQFLSDLKQMGHDVRVVQFVRNNAHSINDFDLENSGISVYTLRNTKSKLLNYVLGCLSLLVYMLKVDFVYLFYPNSLKYSLLFSQLFRVKYGLYIRGMVGVDTCFSQMLYKRAKVVFTVSDYLTKMVNSVVKHSIAYTIRPMIPYSDLDIVYNRQYSPKEKYRILYLGRLAKDKGLLELVEAVDILKKRKYDFNVEIVGDGDFSHELNELVKYKKLTDMIKIEGAVYDKDKKKEYYLKSDIYILPTYHEGFPRTLYEAMIFGTPIITTFVGGISSIMKDKVNCLRIEPRSSESIANSLQYAIDNYEEMVYMAKEGTKLVSAIVDRRRLTHAQHLHQILIENER